MVVGRKKRKPWTTSELARTAVLYMRHTAAEVAGITGRSESAVWSMAEACGWRKLDRWTTADLRRLAERPEGVTIRQVARELGKPYETARHYAAQLRRQQERGA